MLHKAEGNSSFNSYIVWWNSIEKSIRMQRGSEPKDESCGELNFIKRFARFQTKAIASKFDSFLQF